jgi:hypothetical protein
LAESIGEEELTELAKAAGTVNCQGAGDLQSSEGRGRETLAQHGETRAQGRADAEAPGSAKVSDLAETPDRRTPILESTPDRRSPPLESTPDRATAGSIEPRQIETCGPVHGRGHETLAQQSETDACGDSSDVSPMGQNICNNGAILRNEPIAAPDDSGGRARNAEEDAPGS